MSTELLTRRMDLIHSNLKSTTYNRDILQMDTSYPVRLSGIIVKVFLATSNYTKKQANGSNLDPTSTKFIVKGQGNINDNIITEIPLQNVYDFAGHKFKNNGFIGNDYVISIIDIDTEKARERNSCLFLCFFTLLILEAIKIKGCDVYEL